METTQERYTSESAFDESVEYEVGQRVLVSTRPGQPGPTMRDSAGLWGFERDEWREATVSDVRNWSSGNRYAVQFHEGDCHWSFCAHEMRPI